MEKKAEELYTKIAGTHPRPQFSVDEQVLIILKCTETSINSVLEITRPIFDVRQFSNEHDQRTVQASTNGQVGLNWSGWRTFEQERRQ